MRSNCRIPIMACLILIIAIAGCANREAQLVGKWKVKMDVSKQASANTGKPEDLGKAMGNAMGAMFGAMINMELKQDHTYTMTVMFFPVEGKWSLSGDTVTLTPEKVMGMPAGSMKSSNKS